MSRRHISRRLIVALSGLLILLPVPARSQQQVSPAALKDLQGEIALLKEQIRKLEEKAATARGAVREINQDAINSRRIRLGLLEEREKILAQIADLRAYEKEMDFLTVEEKKRIEEQVKALEKEYSKLKDDGQPQASAEILAVRSEGGTSPASGQPAAAAPHTSNPHGSGTSEAAQPPGSGSNGAEVQPGVAARAGAGIPTAMPPPPPAPPQARAAAANVTNYQTGGEFARTILGWEQTAAASAEREHRFFYNLNISVPLAYGWSPKTAGDFDFGPRWRLWGDVRISSVPQQINTTVREFFPMLAQVATDVKVNEVAQSAEFMAGAEVRVLSTKKLFSSFDELTKQKFTFHLFAGFGAQTPLTPRETLQVFNATPEAITRLGLGLLMPAPTFIAFVSPDRDRFFRQYYAGFRLKTIYFYPDETRIKRFPATLDVAYGQNEAVTGGRFRGGVFRVEGFYPLPWAEASMFYLFGTALMKPARTNIVDPLILSRAPAGTLVPDPSVAIVAIPQINRDFYRIGVGIDLLQVKNFFDQKKERDDQKTNAEDTQNKAVEDAKREKAEAERNKKVQKDTRQPEPPEQ